MATLVIMGSGETAPTMVRTHRAVLAATPPGPRAFIDTTFGFQNNADDLVAKTLDYFADSVGERVEVVRWRRSDAPLVDRERALDLLHRSTWAFAGPGSPSYALRQWEGSAVPAALLDVATRGTLVLGSAAAVTGGAFAIPVYEVYKAGADPEWLDGLDVLGVLTGIRAAVVPHYNNNEGGSYDTRFCYLGEPRLALLEAMLPDDACVVGVDEHTALLIDTSAGTATVSGTGVVTVRRHGASEVLPPGTELPIVDLVALAAGVRAAGLERVALVPGPDASVPDDQAEHSTSLRAAVEAAAARFDAAHATLDAEGCASAALELEDAMHAWRHDMLQSDDMDQARRALRSMVVRLGALAERGTRDPREAVAPFVEALLEVRAGAKAARDFATADLVRDGLVAAGVEVRDTPDGAEWLLSPA